MKLLSKEKNLHLELNSLQVSFQIDENFLLVGMISVLMGICWQWWFGEMVTQEGERGNQKEKERERDKQKETQREREMREWCTERDAYKERGQRHKEIDSEEREIMGNFVFFLYIWHDYHMASDVEFKMCHVDRLVNIFH